MVRHTRCTVPAKKTYNKQEPLTIILPCAGMGTRMKSYGSKSLLLINGRGESLISKQIKVLRGVYPQAEIIVVVGFQEDKIRKKNTDKKVKFIYNPLYETTNVVYSIGLAMRSCTNKRVLIVYGDLLFNKYAITAVSQDTSRVVIDEENFKREEVGLSIDGKEIIHFAYDLPIKWAQIIYLVGKELKILREIIYNEQYIRWFGYEVFNQVINKGGSFKVCQPTKMKILEIDCLDDLKKIKERF